MATCCCNVYNFLKLTIVFFKKEKNFVFVFDKNCSYDGSTMKIFVDGQLGSSLAATGAIVQEFTLPVNCLLYTSPSPRD